MTLNYTFDSAVVTSYEGDEEVKVTKENVDFDYDVCVTEEDILDFFKPSIWEGLVDEYKNGFIQALKNTEDYLIETLEKDEDFINFMKERYEDDAREELADE